MSNKSISMIKLKENQSGSISLITVLFITTILSLLAISSLRLMVREREEATDVQLTAQAFYAAESGVDDAENAISKFLAGNLTEAELNKDQCDVADKSTYDHINPTTDEVELDSTGTVAYTCQQIDLYPGEYIRRLKANESFLLKLDPLNDPATQVNKIKIEWHIESESGEEIEPTEDGYAVPRDLDTAEDLPSYSCWGIGSDEDKYYCGDGGSELDTPGYPAMLRLDVLSHPVAGGSTNRGQISNHIGYLNPTSGGAGSVQASDLSSTISESGGSYNDILPNSTSTTAGPICRDSGVSKGQYRCEVEITGMQSVVSTPGQGALSIRLMALYRQAHVRITMYHDNRQLDFVGAQATIDSTGRAADLFRRIKTTVNLNSDTYAPDASLTTASDICKVITIDSSYRDEICEDIRD